jgi:hypothetical protein
MGRKKLNRTTEELREQNRIACKRYYQRNKLERNSERMRKYWEQKTCGKCNRNKLLNNFYKQSKSHNYHPWCKECYSEWRRNYKHLNKEKIKEYSKQYIQKNRLRLNAYNRKYRQTNDVKMKMSKNNKKYRDKNVNKLKILKQKWYQLNKHRICENRRNNKERLRKWQANRMATNINAKLSSILRGRLNKALQHNYKSGSAVRDLGCSIPEFKLYIESKFISGMTWKNYGIHGWHIDHKKPLSSFNLSDRQQFLEACNYANLQPLWASDNLKKSDNI